MAARDAVKCVPEITRNHCPTSAKCAPILTDAALWTNGCYAQEAGFAKFSETAETRCPVEPCEPIKFRR